MKKILILIPWFGPWPEWIDLFIETCKWNPTIDWLFITDTPRPQNRVDNVRYLVMSLDDFNKKVSEKLDMDVRLNNGYKFCDLRPALGFILEEHLAGYDYFGFGDCDVFYGDLRSFLTDELLTHEALSFHEPIFSGHFMLLKNCEKVLKGFQVLDKDQYEDILNQEYGTGFDVAFDHYGLDDIFHKEFYSTPGLITCIYPGLPWTDGTFNYPTEWYWREGKITNNLDNREFMYFHFMVWKGGHDGRYFGGGQWEKLDKIMHFDFKKQTAWKVNENGIFET